jgi:hypothetical protein
VISITTGVGGTCVGAGGTGVAAGAHDAASKLKIVMLIATNND